MITPLNILLILIWTVAVPYIAGGLIPAAVKDKSYGQSIAGNLSCGFMIMCVLFIIPAIPMILMHVPFHVLKYTWIILIALICLLSVLLNLRQNHFKAGIMSALRNSVREILKDKFTLCIFIAAIGIIIFETCLLTFRMHTDTDDARFIVDAMEALNKDTMLEYNPITGIHHGIPVGEQVKDVTAPYPVFIALISSLTKVHPAVMAHTVMPALFIPLCYLVFSLISRVIFKEDIKSRGLFLFLLSLIHLFSFETIYSSGYTLLTIIWQGRSIVAVIMLPLTWYFLLRAADESGNSHSSGYRLCDFLLAGLSALACAMLSNMGSLFAFILCMAYALSFAIQDRKIRPLVYMGLVMVPDIAVIAASRLLSSGILYR